jgi:hypothetical protein
MALERYGVLRGTLAGHHRDRPDAQGRWFHVNLDIDAPAGRYRAAVDVDSKGSSVGVRWRVVPLAMAALGPVAGLPPGYHDLTRAPGGGALDYQRHPALTGRRGCLAPGWPGAGRPRWSAGSNLDAATALEAVLRVGGPVLVFGEPFRTGLGMHNVHQNQGDPAGSQWWAENGTWQDGAVLAARPDGGCTAFLPRFASQATETDDDGHPV